MSQDTLSQPVTLSLKSIVELSLGTELKGTRVLPSYEDGLILQAKFKGGKLYYVQFEHFDGTPLEFPILWSYQEWYDSSTRWKRDKENSEKNRIKHWILNANIKIVTKRLVDVYMFDEVEAGSKARQLLSKDKLKTIRALGVERLVTREEELF